MKTYAKEYISSIIKNYDSIINESYVSSCIKEKYKIYEKNEKNDHNLIDYVDYISDGDNRIKDNSRRWASILYPNKPVKEEKPKGRPIVHAKVVDDSSPVPAVVEVVEVPVDKSQALNDMQATDEEVALLGEVVT